MDIVWSSHQIISDKANVQFTSEIFAIINCSSYKSKSGTHKYLLRALDNSSCLSTFVLFSKQFRKTCEGNIKQYIN